MAKFCPECGEAVKDAWKRCPECGCELPGKKNTEREETATVEIKMKPHIEKRVINEDDEDYDDDEDDDEDDEYLESEESDIVDDDDDEDYEDEDPDEDSPQPEQKTLLKDPQTDPYYNDVLPDVEDELYKTPRQMIVKIVGAVVGLFLLIIVLILQFQNV